MSKNSGIPAEAVLPPAAPGARARAQRVQARRAAESPGRRAGAPSSTVTR